MGYCEAMADRVREVLDTDLPVTERRMFGGLAFLVGGHMAVACSGEGGLMVRVEADDRPGLLGRDHVGPMVMGGRELRTWLRVDDAGLRTRRQLAPWVARGVAVADALPPKTP